MKKILSKPTCIALRWTACLALSGVAAACGSKDPAAEASGSGHAAPTADEVNAAQASSQSTADGSEAGSAASQSSTARQASLRAAPSSTATATATASAGAGTLTLKRARCWSDAIKSGQQLKSSGDVNIQAHLFGGTSAATVTTLTSSFAAGSKGVNIGILTGGASGVELNASASAAAGGSATVVPVKLPLIFNPAYCTLGGHVLSGNELVTTTASTTTASGTLHDLQVIAELTYNVGGGTLQISSEDATKATYELQTSLDAPTATRTFALVLNEHRVRTNASAKVDLDVATTTPSVGDANALVVAETYAQVSASDAASTAAYASVATREVVSGTVTTVHNLAKFTAQHTFSALKHDLTGSCSCPVSGSMMQTAQAADKSRTAAHTYVFTGCGQATVTSNVTTAAGSATGTSQVTWANCS